MSIYKSMKDRHQQEMNNFPMFFAFSNEQFNKGMNKLGLNENDTDKIYSIGGGGFIRKTDSQLLHSMFNRHKKEIQEAMKNENFAYDAFHYELANHEYRITGSTREAIYTIGLSVEEVNNNTMLLNALQRACNGQ